MNVISQLLNSFSANGNAAGQTQMKNKNGIQVATKPQLDLFGSHLIAGEEGLVRCSSGAEFTSSLWMWEEIPKYIFSTWLVKSLLSPDSNKIYVVPFKLSTVDENGKEKKVDAKVEITPATIINSKGEEVTRYPSDIEEFVEEAIKILIMMDQGHLFMEPGSKSKSYYDGKNQVYFTLRDIKRVLAAMGRDCCLSRIKEAIEVMEKCNIKITTASGRSMSTNLLGGVKTISSDELSHIKKGRNYEFVVGLDYVETEVEQSQRMHIVSLPELVSQSIATLRYRSINTAILSAIKCGLGRDVYRRLSNRYVQAGKGVAPYDLRLSHMESTGRLWKKCDKKYNLKQASIAMDELVKNGVIEPGWVAEKITDPRDKRAYEDVKYHFKVTELFVAHQKKANSRASKLEEKQNKLIGEKALQLINGGIPD